MKHRHKILLFLFITTLCAFSLKDFKLLSKHTTKGFYASDGWVDLYANGAVRSQNDFHLFENGVKSLSNKIVKNSNEVSGVSKVRLGLNGGNSLFKVDNALKSADELAGVLVNGSYKLNPTARNVNSLIKNPSGVMKLDQSASSIINGEYMYVIDESDNIIIGTRTNGLNFSNPDGKAPHPTLIGGSDPTVKTAGIIEFRGGKIYRVDNVSGHFKPSAQSLQNAQPIFFQKFDPNNFTNDFQGFIPFSN
jgi:hypothetical protein